MFRLKKAFILLLFLLIGSHLLPQNLQASDWQIHTFGGGELITTVLNMVKLILYGNSKTGLGAAFSGFAKIILALSSISAAIILIFKQSPGFYFKNFLIPSFFVLNALLLPRTDVVIHDEAIRNSTTTKLASVTKVDNVPFLYGAFISLLSELSYNFTKLLEQCTHQVNDRIYNWTGRIYAGEYALRLKNDYLFSKDLESNFREYCKTCVWNDLERGLYSKQELINSPNLLQFLKERTSNLNTVSYLNHHVSDNKKEFLTCREAIQKMSDEFQNKGVLKGPMDFIDKWLPTSNPSLDQQMKNLTSSQIDPQETDLNYLLGQSQNNTLSSLRIQSGLIKMLKEELPGTQTSFAARRAEAQNREGMKTTGAIAASNLVTMKNVFEALTYFSFPLVCLFTLIPLMQKLILSWMKVCIWLATLAPFYVIINAILNIIWHKKKSLMFGDNTSLTIYTHDGLLDLYDSMESVAALAIGSIFTLTLVLTRSGFANLGNVLPSLFSSEQSAANAAAVEKVTGNYSFQNVSVGNTTGYNYDAFKQNYSGSLGYGGVSINDPSQSTNYDFVNNQAFVRQENSQLRDSISQTDGFSQSIQLQQAMTESAISEEGSQFSDSMSNVANHTVGLLQAYASHSQRGQSLSLTDSMGAQQTFQKMDSLANEYSKAHNVSYEQAVREMTEAGVGINFGLRLGGHFSAQDGSVSSEVLSNSDKYAQAESFSHLLQEVSNYSSSEMGQVMDSKDLRKHEDFSDHWSKTASIADHLRTAYSKQENLSHLQNDAHSSSINVQRNLDQYFVNYLRDTFNGDMGAVNEILNKPSNDLEKLHYINEFVTDYKPDALQERSIKNSYESYKTAVDRSGSDIRSSTTGFTDLNNVVPEMYRDSKKLDRNIDDLRDKQSSLPSSPEKNEFLEKGERLQTEASEASQLKNLNKLITVRAGKAGVKYGAKIIAGRPIMNASGTQPQKNTTHHYPSEDE